LAISQIPLGKAFKEGIPGFSCTSQLFITLGVFFGIPKKNPITPQEAVTEAGVFYGSSGPARSGRMPASSEQTPASSTPKTFLLISSSLKPGGAISGFLGTELKTVQGR